MNRLAADALAATNKALERHGAPAVSEWPRAPHGRSPLEVLFEAQSFTDGDVAWVDGCLRWWWAHGVLTSWKPPRAVREFVADCDAGRYPALVAPF